jgi:hypothetical protein
MSQLTLDNPIPAGFGTLTYAITDGKKQTVSLTVPADGTVQHPTDAQDGPWSIVATLNGPGLNGPSLTFLKAKFTDPNAEITSMLKVVPAPPGESSPDAGTAPTGSAGFVPGKSLLDTASWQSVVARSLELEAPPESMKLALTVQDQAQDQWCWAAVTSSVYAFYAPKKNPITQCELANSAFEQSNCCTSSQAAKVKPCNQPHSLTKALSEVKCLQSATSKRLLFSDVVAQIAAKAPVGIRVTWGSSKDPVGHVLCITGYAKQDSDQKASIDLSDPTFGETIVPFGGFPGNYHTANGWTHSYLTQSPT